MVLLAYACAWLFGPADSFCSDLACVILVPYCAAMAIPGFAIGYWAANKPRAHAIWGWIALGIFGLVGFVLPPSSFALPIHLARSTPLNSISVLLASVVIASAVIIAIFAIGAFVASLSRTDRGRDKA